MAERIQLLDCPVHHRQPGDGSANNGRFWRYCGASGCELSTAWVLSRNEAITSWNDLVVRISKPAECKTQEATMADRKPWVIRTRSASRIDSGIWVRLEDVGALVEAAGAWHDNPSLAIPRDRLMEVVDAMQTLGIMYPAGEGAGDGE